MLGFWFQFRNSPDAILTARADFSFMLTHESQEQSRTCWENMSAENLETKIRSIVLLSRMNFAAVVIDKLYVVQDNLGGE